MTFGRGDLRGGEALPFDEPVELRTDDGGSRARARARCRRRSGIYRRRRRSSPVREHRVREAARLTDLLEQARRHPAAEHLVHDRQRVAVGIERGERAHAGTMWVARCPDSARASAAGRRPLPVCRGRARTVGGRKRAPTSLPSTLMGRGCFARRRRHSRPVVGRVVRRDVVARHRIIDASLPSTSSPEREVDRGRSLGEQASWTRSSWASSRIPISFDDPPLRLDAKVVLAERGFHNTSARTSKAASSCTSATRT